MQFSSNRLSTYRCLRPFRGSARSRSGACVLLCFLVAAPSLSGASSCCQPPYFPAVVPSLNQFRVLESILAFSVETRITGARSLLIRCLPREVKHSLPEGVKLFLFSFPVSLGGLSGAPCWRQPKIPMRSRFLSSKDQAKDCCIVQPHVTRNRWIARVYACAPCPRRKGWHCPKQGHEVCRQPLKRDHTVTRCLLIRSS